jgi:hypothetical protein
MVEEIWKWAMPRYAALVYQNTKDIRIKEAAGRDCDFNAEQYENDYETEIPLSLEGWKYDDEEFQTALEDWKEMWSHVKVFMFSTDDPEYVGQYTDKNNTIDVVIDTKWLDPSPEEYKTFKESIHRTIEHECIHLGQYIFKHFKGIEFGGMPSKHISDTEYTPEGQHEKTWEEKGHPLRDIEFYSILNDAKIELRKWLSSWPEDMHYGIFQLYVGTTPARGKQSASQEFFAKLREKEPEKWQKAVLELYKALSPEFPNIFRSKEAFMYISKRAKGETKRFKVLLQPTKNQLEHFMKQQGIEFHPFKDRPDPFLMVTESEEDAYYDGLHNAFEFALQTFRDLAKQYNFRITEDFLDYAVMDKGQEIRPAELEIETEEPDIVSKLKNHPLVRGMEPIESLSINEVYV